MLKTNRNDPRTAGSHSPPCTRRADPESVFHRQGGWCHIVTPKRGEKTTDSTHTSKVSSRTIALGVRARTHTPAHTHSHWHALTRTHTGARTRSHGHTLTRRTLTRACTHRHTNTRARTQPRARTLSHTHTHSGPEARARGPPGRPRSPSRTDPWRPRPLLLVGFLPPEARSPLEAQTHAQHKDEVGEDGGGRGGRGRRLTRTEARSREARAVQAPGREPLPGPRPGAPSGWPLPAPARARAGMFTQSWSYNGSTRIAGTRAGSGGQSGPSSRAVTPPTAHRFHSSAVTFPPGWLTCVAAHVPCTAYRQVCHIPRGPKGLLLEAGGKG